MKLNVSELKRNLRLLRRTLSSLCLRLMLEPLRILPVKRNRVLFSSYMEKQYSCNPKYISEKLRELAGDKLEIGWAFRNPEKFEFLKAAGIKALNASSFEFFKYAMRSRVICYNTYFKPSLPRRKSQFIINTWHGGGAYKKVGKYVDMPLIERLNTRLRQGKTDLYLSSSRFFSENVIRDSFGYRGEILEKGMPRNDILINRPNEAKIGEIRRKIGLKPGEKLCLYAPTYRRDTLPHDFGMDYDMLASALTQRFGGNWVCGYRSHHVSMFKDNSKAAKTAVDLSEYGDMQELLLVCDVLITDYSSSIWDAALGKINTFLFTPDIDKYLKERAFYTDIDSWPFLRAETMSALTENILSFDRDKYLIDIQAHLDELGSCESGKAAEFMAKRILKEIYPEDNL